MQPLSSLAVLTLVCGTASAADPPVLTHLEVDVLAPSGRVSVHGQNLDQAGQVHVGGVPAQVFPIQGTNAVEMNAYLPETMPYGVWDVTVTTAAGTSNALPLTVVPRKPEGRALWRFVVNSPTNIHRPAIGPDGTIYTKSAEGDLIALSPDGAMKWLYKLGIAWTPEIDVGPDGTIYTADGWPRIHAVNPDGTPKWVYTEPALNNGVVAGPNVGPDGNVYVVSHSPGDGVYSLDPQGNLRWKGSDNPYSPIGQKGQEIVFSDAQLFFCQNGVYDSFRFDGTHVSRNFVITSYNSDSPQPAATPGGTNYVEYWGRLKAFDAGGNELWTAFDVGGSYLQDPDVGPDGTIYVWRNVFGTQYALNPDGSEKWQFIHPDNLLDAVVNPAGDTLVVGGGTNSPTEPNFVFAMDAKTRAPRWQLDLPIEDYPYLKVKTLVQGRPRFSADGTVAYVNVSGPSSPHPGHSYVYAVQVEPVAALGHALGGSAGEPRLTGTGSLEAGSPLQLRVEDAKPDTPVFFVVGTEAIALPLFGGVLLPKPDLVLKRTADGSGAAELNVTWPSGIAADTPTYVQVWVPDPAGPAGWAASNALSLIAP